MLVFRIEVNMPILLHRLKLNIPWNKYPRISWTLFSLRTLYLKGLFPPPEKCLVGVEREQRNPLQIFCRINDLRRILHIDFCDALWDKKETIIENEMLVQRLRESHIRFSSGQGAASNFPDQGFSFTFRILSLS